ncbi:uncharacterized protein LOC127375944 isoform X2 [Dicentrarchus labrax]|uniref:uncharacterized protein LOC127375944 isoform X2 n=1 Tax=Dicentrarchus labrax TaxID=13489 RepID=UPI0021F547EC|nr:uncharacterized protein LOC127375944 isoform X2 [Dicentrarchus labrax]
MEACTSTASRGKTVSPNPFMRAQRSLCFHQDHGPMGFPPEALNPRACKGFCCALQQRPSSGRATHRVTPQSTGGGDGSLIMLSSLKGRLESRAKPASKSRTGSRPEMTPSGGAAPTVCHHRDPVSETAETPTPTCNNEMKTQHGQPGAAKVSQLHLYLPSSLCDDEEQEAETEEMRTSAEEPCTQGSDVEPNNSDHPNTGPGIPQRSTPSDDITPEDSTAVM